MTDNPEVQPEIPINEVPFSPLQDEEKKLIKQMREHLRKEAALLRSMPQWKQIQVVRHLFGSLQKQAAVFDLLHTAGIGFVDIGCILNLIEMMYKEKTFD